MSTMFKDLQADDGDLEPTEIESMCPNCEENGMTKLLLTKIPFYKEVILMSFECPSCGHKNNEIQSGAKVEEQGAQYRLRVRESEDLNREVIKSEYASVNIPEVSLEIPHKSQPAEITTVEGIIRRTMEGLEQDQKLRWETAPEQAEKIVQFLCRLNELLSCKRQFTLIIDDPSANSFIQNPNPGRADPRCTLIHYHRTMEQDRLLGFLPDYPAGTVAYATDGEESEAPVWESRAPLGSEVFSFGVECPACGAALQTNMKLVNVPYFKEVVVMGTHCDACGYRSSDIQSAAGIGSQGVRLTVRVETAEDMARDVLKSETCALEIPELDLEAGMGILSGRFTTVEGVFSAIKDQLEQQATLYSGDSGDAAQAEKMNELFAKFDAIISGQKPATLILDDPAGNSYVQSFCGSEPDSRLQIVFYERSEEQKEELGLNDMNTEQTDQPDR